jgi:arabinofuranosyltransferase
VSDGVHLGRDDVPWLASLLLAGCLTLGLFALTACRLTDGEGGVPLDDAWIHFQFARNLARGDGLSFNPDQPTSGSTAPLWTLLLAGVYLAGAEFPVAGQLLSGACFLAALASTYALGVRLTGKRWAGWLAGMVVAANGRMVWAGLSALETCLFAALSLLAIGAHVSDRTAARYRLRTAALFGLAALTRPEGYLLFALSLVDFALRIVCSVLRVPGHATRNTKHETRITYHVSRITYYVLRSILLPAVLFAAIVLPYLIFSLRTSGHLLPNTYHAKAVVSLLPDRDFLSVAARYLILDNPLLLPFYVLGVGVLLFPALSGSSSQVRSPKARASLLSLWSVGLPLVYAYLHAVLYQHGRYLIPLIPCNAIVGVVGLLAARRLAARRWNLTPALSLGGRRGRGLAVLVGVLVVAGTGWRLPAMARLYAWNVDNVNEMHVAVGRWVAEHTPPDAVLALNDIGAITYVSERPVVDLAGLVTPEVVPLLHAPDRDAHLADLMAEQGVQYVVIFPNWFPGLAARTDVLEPVYQVTLEKNTIAGGETMVVYRAHWRR